MRMMDTLPKRLAVPVTVVITLEALVSNVKCLHMLAVRPRVE
jgi:hypothetical protein